MYVYLSISPVTTSCIVRQYEDCLYAEWTEAIAKMMYVSIKVPEGNGTNVDVSGSSFRFTVMNTRTH